MDEEQSLSCPILCKYFYPNEEHITYRESRIPSTNPPQPTRLKPQQLEERREKGPWFSCDSKYSKGHKCDEKNAFYINN